MSRKDGSVEEVIAIADGFDSAFSIGQLAERVRIADELPLDAGEAQGLFLLNLAVDKAFKLTEQWLSIGHSHAQFWVTYENWKQLTDLQDNLSHLVISRVSYDEDWIKLTITADSSNQLDVDGFIAGLQALEHGSSQSDQLQIESRVSEPSFRALLINRLVPIVKPLKRFIPHKIVIQMYKVLEKLR